MSRSYLKHTVTGEVFVMGTDGDEITGAAGPLLDGEIGDVYDHDLDPEDAGWMQAELDAGRFASLSHEEYAAIRRRAGH